MLPPVKHTLRARPMLFEALVLTAPVLLLVAGLVGFTIHRDAQGLQQTTGRPPAPALRP